MKDEFASFVELSPKKRNLREKSSSMLKKIRRDNSTSRGMLTKKSYSKRLEQVAKQYDMEAYKQMQKEK